MKHNPSVPNTHTSKRISVSVAIILTLIVSIVLVAAGTIWVKSQFGKSGFTENTTRKQFVIGNDVLNIPLNLTRFPHQRDNSVQDKIDIALHWPDGEGYSAENSASFNDVSGIADIIFISLSKQELRLDMSQRLEPIYSKLFEGSPQTGPADLIFQGLKPGAGYDGERLAIFSSGVYAWVARCQIERAGVHTTCLRDINLGASLSVRVRFSTNHLPRWRRIENLVINTLENLLTN